MCSHQTLRMTSLNTSASERARRGSERWRGEVHCFCGSCHCECECDCGQ